jgi:hypothetical protein
MRDVLSTTFGRLPDPRQADRVDYSLHDTLMSGFAMLFFQHASLLAFQRKMKQHRGRCNLATLFGVHEVPSDTQRREILDGVPPELLRQVLPELFEKVRRAGWAKECNSTVPSGDHQGDYYTGGLDGSDYFHSTTIQWPGCVQRTAASGQRHFRHTGVAATLVKAGSHRGLPRDVAEVRNSDGQDTQDWEVNAAKRLLPRLRQAHPQLPLMIGGDALYCHEPCMAQWRERRLHHVLVGTPTSHAARSAWVEDIEQLDGCDKGQWHEGPACRRRFSTYRIARSLP